MLISPAQLDDAIKEILSDVSEDIREEVNTAAKKAAKKAVKELKSSSPKDKGDYAKSWGVKEEGNSITGSKKYIVHNKKYYRLTHLLEHGHVNRDGSRARAFPHIAKVNDEVCEEFVKDVEKAINEM